MEYKTEADTIFFDGQYMVETEDKMIVPFDVNGTISHVKVGEIMMAGNMAEGRHMVIPILISVYSTQYN